MFLFFFSFIASHNVFLYYWSRCCFCCSVYVYCREQSKSNVVLSWYEMINALCMCTKIQVPSERKNSLGSPIRKKNFLFAISCLRLLTICTGRSDQFARTSVTNQRTQTFTSLIYIFCIGYVCAVHRVVINVVDLVLVWIAVCNFFFLFGVRFAIVAVYVVMYRLIKRLLIKMFFVWVVICLFVSYIWVYWHATVCGL